MAKEWGYIIKTNNVANIKNINSNALIYDENSADMVFVDKQTTTFEYTTSDGQIYDVSNDIALLESEYNLIYDGPQIISNVYENGVGKLTFAGEIKEIGIEGAVKYNSIDDIDVKHFNAIFLDVDGNTTLTSITIPEGVTSIGMLAFQHCTNLHTVNLPSTITEIGPLAFQECESLTNITIPSSVNKIGIYAFLGCTSLSSINIPSGISVIGNEAFCMCTSLSTVNYNDTDHSDYSGIMLALEAGGVSANTNDTDVPLYYSDAQLFRYTQLDGDEQLGEDGFVTCVAKTRPSIDDLGGDDW